MAKNKRRPIKRFCKTCQKRTVFNRTREDALVCSRCGIILDTVILEESMKIKNPYQNTNI